MNYKGYTGKVEYDSEAKIFHGRVIGLKDVINFQGTTTEEIEIAFKDSINDYLEWCAERGEKPEKPYSGKLNIRIPSQLHAKLAQQASINGLSLNNLIIEKLNN